MKHEELPALAFVDIETTGLSYANGDRICEIAVLRTFGREDPAKWQTLVNPMRPISPGASAVNGITDEMVSVAPAFKDIAPKFLEIIDGAVLVFHNAGFDLGFISKELQCLNIEMPEVKVVDTLSMARRYFDFPSNSLGNIASHIGIRQDIRHRAFADVYTTFHVFSHLFDEIVKNDICDFKSLMTTVTF